MRTGRLRHRVKLQAPYKDNTPGAGDITWQDYATVWMAIEPLRGTEFVAAQQMNAEVTGKGVMRYIPGVTPDMRILDGARIFEILAIVDVEERHRELQLMLKERVR